LSEVVFEEGSVLTRIEKKAFEMCRLQVIVIPSRVEVLCEGSFCHCDKLREIAFEEGSELKRIETEAFAECSVKSVCIPAKVELLAGSALVGINCVVINPENEHFYEDECCIYDKSGCTLVRCLAPLSDFSVPCNVEVLGDGCFRGLNSLSAVRFEEGSRLKRIEKCAFCECGIIMHKNSSAC
jgi:hypothetical protein